MGVLVLTDKLAWKTDDPCQLGTAAQWFDELKAAGCTAARPDGTPLDEFDPNASEIIMSMPMPMQAVTAEG